MRTNHRGPLSLRGMRILFEDEELIVVDKPARLLTIATAVEKRQTAYALLFDYLKSKKRPERVFVVHRLDRDASGLLVFAKTELAKRRLQAQFKDRSASRKYVAVAEGGIEAVEAALRSYLRESPAYRSHSTQDPRRGQLAITHIRVLRRGRHSTLLEARLESGRKHQIRAHLAELGHPIVGDLRYGSTRNPLRRLALHAASLELVHPRTGRVLQFRSAYPPSFRTI